MGATALLREALHPLGLAATRTRGAKAREVVAACTTLGVGGKRAEGTAEPLSDGEALRLSMHALTVAATGCAHHPPMLAAAISALLQLLAADLLRGVAFAEALQVDSLPALRASAHLRPMLGIRRAPADTATAQRIGFGAIGQGGAEGCSVVITGWPVAGS
jgi:hypothetical protein